MTAEGTTDGLWNKVSAHVTWIREQAEKLGEKLEECAVPKVDEKLGFGNKDEGGGSEGGDSEEETTTETESQENTTESGEESTTEKDSGGLSDDASDEPGDSAEPVVFKFRRLSK